MSNSAAFSQPDFFGARGSAFMRLLMQGRCEVAPGPEDMERLATWMDANALFYGTLDPVDQARRQRGEPIEEPKLEWLHAAMRKPFREMNVDRLDLHQGRNQMSRVRLLW